MRRISGALLLLFLALLSPALGAEEPRVPEISADARAALEEVLLSPDFGGEKPGWGIRFKSRQQGNRAPRVSPAPWIAGIARAFAWGLRFVLVGGILILGGLLFFRLRKQNREKNPVPVQAGLPVLPWGESPRLLLDKARSLHGEGKIREAWGCCFSAAKAAFSQYRGLAFPPNATEYDCLALAPVPGFRALVSAWVNLAYGGKNPPEGAFTGALDFCSSLLNPQGESPVPEETHG
ncbi:MAG: hypothetical protein LBL19_07425 [Spirochaetaceae bacterium]|nr:hypothetical protein [Spirochaetaceae bacterium]